jgi:hypothetical protein
MRNLIITQQQHAAAQSVPINTSSNFTPCFVFGNFLKLAALCLLFAACSENTVTPPPLAEIKASYNMNGVAMQAREYEVDGYFKSYIPVGTSIENNLMKTVFIVKAQDNSTLFFAINAGDRTYKKGDKLQVDFVYDVKDEAKPLTTGSPQLYKNGVSIFVNLPESPIPVMNYVGLPLPFSPESEKSYFEITRNDENYLEGTFNFVYGTPTLITKKLNGSFDTIPAKVYGTVRNGFVSVKKPK